MPLLLTLAAMVVLFLALPWLAVAFKRYCAAVNRHLAKRAQRRSPRA